MEEAHIANVLKVVITKMEDFDEAILKHIWWIYKQLMNMYPY
jgi:hypothetical protein